MGVIFNHFPQLKRAMKQSVAGVVHDTTEAILTDSQAAVPVREGALKASGRTAYSDDGMQAIAGYDDFKAVWNEYGTGEPASTRAQPFLTPAAESHRAGFEDAMRRIEPRP